LHYGEIFTLGSAERRADPSARTWPSSISTQYARARTRASWGLRMKPNNWVERFVAARLAEHDERARLRRVSRASTLQEAKSKVEKYRNFSERTWARTATAKHGGR
jgi:hypothetical protein